MPATVGETLRWYAIHTRSRYEKRVAAQLRERQIRSFLPLIAETHRWSDRKKVVEQPLFPGYVFTQIADLSDTRLSILKTVGVAGFVGTKGKGTPIPDKEIENVQSILASSSRFTVHPFLRVGQRVRIRGGCLDGVEGILLAKNVDRSVVVSIELIQRSVAVRVEGFDIERVYQTTPPDAARTVRDARKYEISYRLE
ncbi:MAG: UpxY family transcription antiterminator [Acidobacteriia bacterium]|nr:UpxY family transcription antiterminator [Terriglobia bacterium]